MSSLFAEGTVTTYSRRAPEEYIGELWISVDLVFVTIGFDIISLNPGTSIGPMQEREGLFAQRTGASWGRPFRNAEVFLN